jgi:uncharacterized membrane protein
MTTIGPVQMVVVAFDSDADFEGRIMDELAKLERERTIRILDLLFVLKDAETGELVALEHQGADLGAIAGALLGFEFEGAEALEAPPSSEGGFGLSAADVQGVGAALAPGQSAAFLLIEHVWARDLKSALRDAGGIPVMEGFLTPETMRAVEPELAAMADALNELSAEGAVPAASA